MNKLSKEIYRFLITGILAFAIDYSLLYIFTEYFKIHVLVSSTLSFFISLVINYILSTKWVFQTKKDTKEFIFFVIFSVIGLLINQVIMKIGIYNFKCPYMIVKVFATGIVMVYNFITRKFLLFTKKSNT